MDDNFIKQDIITADFRYDEGLRVRRGGWIPTITTKCR